MTDVRQGSGRLGAALVSGAGIGIGAAIARALGREGYHVFVSDILTDEGEAVVAEINAAGGAAEFAVLDVCDTAACDGLIATINARFGALSALVANAGIAPRLPYQHLSDDKWDKVFDVNLKGEYRLIRSAAPAMAARGRGAIVCMASLAGTLFGWDDHWHYSATKAGVTGLVRAAAAELGKHGVRVNCVSPGLVRTAQSLSEENSLGAAGLDAASSRVLLRRIGDPSELAEVVAFLVSDKASYVTGQVINVDGGLSIAM